MQLSTHTYTCIYHFFFIHSSLDEHLGCFHLLTIVISAAIRPSFLLFFYLKFDLLICLLGDPRPTRKFGGAEFQVANYSSWKLELEALGKTVNDVKGNPLQYFCLENPMDGGAWCPWDRKESDMTERLHFFFFLSLFMDF